MAYTTVAKPSAHCEAKTYTGSSSAVSVTGVGFKPDIVWTKDRTEAHAFGMYDSSRGIKRWLKGNATQSENNNSGASVVDASLTSFDSAGFTIATMSTDPIGNKNGNYFRAWMWKANGGTTSSNGSGSTTSTVQANTTAGMSIVTYAGTGENATIGHGLGVAPKFILTKNRTNNRGWGVYHGATEIVTDTQTDYMELNAASGWNDDNTYWNDTAPTSTLFSVGTNNSVNEASCNMVAYCFSQIQGYSHFGTYWGSDDSADGPMVYCGFRPKIVIIKRTDGNENWQITDSACTQIAKDGSAGRQGNRIEQKLQINTGSAENSTSGDLDFYSTGFKLRDTDGMHNWTDYKYVYAAFADHPIVGTNGTVGLAF